MTTCNLTQTKLCGNTECITCFNRSFASYDKLKVDCWDYEKNGSIKPIDVMKGSGKKYYFNCYKCKHSFNTDISNVTGKGQRWCPYCCHSPKLCKDIECDFCFNNSFASFKGETSDGKLKVECWDYEKNSNIIPRNIIKGTNIKYYFNCDKCNHSFNNIPSSNNWCAFCVNQKLCTNNKCNMCFNNSFASFEGKTSNDKLKIDYWDYTKNGVTIPRNIFQNASSRYWFKCNNCYHSFNSTPNNMIRTNCWCPYCSIPCTKLCNNIECNFCFDNSFASFKGKTSNNKLKVKCWDYEKNKNVKPQNVTKGTEVKYWFNCDVCTHSFNTRINSITKESWCPLCKNKTEAKFLNWLKSNYTYEITYQPKYDWCKSPDTNRYLPFDFCIEKLKLIIETDGAQHFFQVSNWASPEDVFEHDVYKMRQAYNNGYTIIRICQENIYNDANNWEINTREVIKSYDESQVICIGCDVKYEKYNNIENNIIVEEKKYNCDICDRGFKFKSQFNKHCKTKSQVTQLSELHKKMFGVIE
jgi:YHS domain-containing protein